MTNSKVVTFTAKEIVAIAMKYFHDFFDSPMIKNVLLEELEYDEQKGVWLVTIGFDVGRSKIQKPSQNALAMFQSEEITPIRESRQFHIADADGQFVKLSDA